MHSRSLSTSTSTSTSTHRGIEPNPRSAASPPEITKTFLLTNTFHAYGMNFLHQKKSIRDHTDELARTM
jgi:hypothetical protein